MTSLTSIKAITNIKNAALAKLSCTVVKYSTTNAHILNILTKGNIIRGFQIKGNDITVSLLNSEIARQRLKNIIVVSKPSKQVYVKLRVLKEVRAKLGSSIDCLTLVSTSYGITTIDEALREGVGGELLFAANSFVTEAVALSR
jgi:ribosomal protein S8